MAAAPHHHANDHSHGHSHRHGDSHGQSHANEHDRSHTHEPAASPRRAAQAGVGLSLLRLSALERGAGALGLVALLWLGVWWALT